MVSYIVGYVVRYRQFLPFVPNKRLFLEMIAEKFIAKVIVPKSSPGYLKEIAIVPNTFRVQDA